MATTPGFPLPEPETFTYKITTELTNITGFSSVAGDDLSLISGDSLFDYLPSTRADDNFSVDLTFKLRKTGTISGVSYTPIEILQFPNAVDKIKLARLNLNTVRIQGNTMEKFDEVYEFVFENGQRQILPPTTDKNFMALVRYSMPKQTRILTEYSFILDTFPSDLPNIKKIQQYSYWTLDSAVETIKGLVKRGV